MIFLKVNTLDPSNKSNFFKTDQRNKNEKGKLINTLKTYIFYKDGRILRKSLFEKENGESVDYLEGMYDKKKLKKTIGSLIKNEMQEISDKEICYSNCKLLKPVENIFEIEVLKTDDKLSETRVVINGEIFYDTSKIYEIEYKSYMFTIIESTDMYTGKNIKDLIEFLNSNLEGGAIIYENIIEN